MNKKSLEEIRRKREFSQLPDKDIEVAYSCFEKRQASDEEKLRLTKELLRKVFSVFISKKLLSPKDKEVEWILRKHASTRERLPYYEEIYERILKDFKKINIIDLGAGINGLSYKFFPKGKVSSYLGVESLGQLVDFMNFYFEKNKFNAVAKHVSLFELEKILSLIKKQKKPRIIFLFKVIDSLEMMERNYSKKLLLEIGNLEGFIALSFATRSLGSRKSFFAKRTWIIKFIQNNFEVLDDFEIGGERYLLFHKCS